MLQPQSHGSDPMNGISTVHRRQPLVSTLLPSGFLKHEMAPKPEEGE
jgi:hypothetical protein